MNKPKLMVCIGKDKQGNPIYKEVKKLIVQHTDKNNVVKRQKSKPFYNGQSWLIKAHERLFFIHPDSIFFDKRLNYYILTKEEFTIVD